MPTVKPEAYQYNYETFEYEGEKQECQIDPLESQMQGKDIWLVPGDCTMKEPPKKKEGYAIIFNKDKNEWEYTPDYREKKVFDGTEIKEWKKIGELPEGTRLLTEEEEKGLNDGTLIIKDGEIVPYVPTLEDLVKQYEYEIEDLNVSMLRDMIILQDPNASEDDKTEAQTYFDKKLKKKEELIEKINELKNKIEEEQ